MVAAVSTFLLDDDDGLNGIRSCRGRRLRANALAQLFGFVERRPQLVRQDAPRKFDRHHRRKSFVHGEDARLDALLVVRLLEHPLLQVRRQRLRESVRQENAEERADERGADLVSDF